jgi:hypothetical protein
MNKCAQYSIAVDASTGITSKAQMCSDEWATVRQVSEWNVGSLFVVKWRRCYSADGEGNCMPQCWLCMCEVLPSWIQITSIFKVKMQSVISNIPNCKNEKKRRILVHGFRPPEPETIPEVSPYEGECCNVTCAWSWRRYEINPAITTPFHSVETGLEQPEQRTFPLREADIYFYKFKQSDTRKYFSVYIELLM